MVPPSRQIVNCDVERCIHSCRADSLAARQRSSNCLEYYRWDQLVAIGDLKEGEKGKRKRECPATNCEYKSINQTEMRLHYFWRHLHLSGGICFFCLVQHASLQKFESRHLPCCLLVVNKPEILFWASSIISEKLPPDIFRDAVLSNVAASFEQLERVNAEQLGFEVYVPPIAVDLIAERPSFTFNDLLFDLANSSMSSSLPKYQYWLNEMRSEGESKSVYIYGDETVRLTTLLEFIQCGLMVGSSMQPDVRVSEHEDKMNDGDSRNTCPSDLRIAEMREAGRSIKGYVLIRGLNKSAVCIVEHAIKSVLCYTSIKSLNERPCINKNNRPPYSTYKDLLQFDVFLLNKAWLEWQKVATVSLREFNEMADILARLQLEHAQLLDENSRMRVGSGMNSQFYGTGGKRPRTGVQRALWIRTDSAFNEKNCNLVPTICQIMKEFTEDSNCDKGDIKISVMQSGSRVFPHCNPTNFVLEAQLGLTCPSEARIRVGKEVRGWKTGKFLVFDKSFEHELWFDGASSTSLRMVLSIDLWHPEVPLNSRVDTVY